jgi:hypothetical protein
MKWIAVLLLGVILGRYLVSNDPNGSPTYGDTGRPKNCRAVIQANIDSVRAREFSADDALMSIERNCGLHGYGWNQ